MPELHPSFRDLEARCAGVFSYLHPGLIGFEGCFAAQAEVLRCTETAGSLFAVLAYAPRPARYGRDHLLLTPEESRQLDTYRELRLVEAWPQPVLHLMQGGAGGALHVAGHDSAARVAVRLMDRGQAQLWHGGGTGVVWEANANCEGEALADMLWDAAEEVLAAAGVRTCLRDSERSGLGSGGVPGVPPGARLPVDRTRDGARAHGDGLREGALRGARAHVS